MMQDGAIVATEH